MSSILSAISGQFSKSLILGTFMPVVLFVILNLFFLLPYLPADPQVFQQIAGVDTRAVIAITFVAVVLTGLLYNLNIPIVRLYEGYTWEHSFFGRWRKGRYEKELRALLELRPRVQDLQEALIRRNKRQASTKNLAALGSIRSDVGRIVNKDFPRLSSVLPTKLGNVIRSFESYPQRQYNMAGITLYPRLIAAVDKEYLGLIDNAKSSFDFMINCSVLSAVLSGSTLVAGLLYPIPLSTARAGVLWLVQILFFLFLSWAFYVSSIGRASEWGDLVKGAFDLYRWKLLEQFGFKRTPENMEAERTLWSAISAQIIFGDRPNARLLEYARPTPYARGVPATAKLETARGMKAIGEDEKFEVTVLVKNLQEQPVEKVRLTDELSEGVNYLWRSAKLLRKRSVWKTVTVTGSNPYYFQIGDLEPKEEVVLSYIVMIPKD